MKNINIVYVAALLIAMVLTAGYVFKGQRVITFYGFAENKETQLNRQQPIEVVAIYVTTGQKVKKGEVLMNVVSADLPVKKEDAFYSIEALKTRYEMRQNEIEASIRNFTNEYNEKSNALQSEIAILQADLANNRKLYESLETLETNPVFTDSASSPIYMKLNRLENEFALNKENYNNRISALVSERDAPNNPLFSRIKILEKEMQFYDQEEFKQAVVAPTDGLIGNVHCKEGEVISPYTPLVTFYEASPTQVVGYIHEELLLKVKINDTISISSTSRPEVTNIGVIRNLGSRIVQIPTRITKIKDFATYGREVLIEIPKNNPFLQKEKVTLTLTTN